MPRTMDLASLLRKELVESQLRNPSYSIRAFARKLGIGFGTLSMVLAGKRSLSQKTTLKVLNQLAVSPELRARLLVDSKPFKRKKIDLPYASTQLSADQYYILSEWHYLAILNLIRTRKFESTPEYVADRLGISIQLAKQSLDRLERTQLIKWERGRLVRTHAATETTDDVQSLAVRRSHYQTLERARLALDEVPIDQRDFTWLTFAFSPERMPEFKKRIREFQDQIAAEFTLDPEATEVYRFGTQLFPLSKRSKKNERV